MLSPDEHPGIFYFMVGMIVLVMTAVGLSLVMDQRFKFSSGVGALKRDIALQSEELASLSSRHEVLAKTLTEGQSAHSLASAGKQEVSAKTEAFARRKPELLGLKSTLQNEIVAIHAAFANYRSSYRQKTWDQAAGQEIGNLSIRGGREYRQVTITKVTDVGLEIKHQDGIARIQAPDLDRDWQDRFQWDDEKRRALLKKESDQLDGGSAASVMDQPADSTEVTTPAVEDPSRLVPAKPPGDASQVEKITQLRAQVIGWQSKIGRLRREQAEASSNAGYGSQTSVPGSLETWKSKAVRLGKELVRAQTEFSLAKSRLAALSPDDSLLKPVPGDNR